MALLDLSLDLLVGALAFVVAGWFFVAWRRLEQPAFAIFAAGLALKGVGYAMGSGSQFDVSQPVDAFDVLRLTAVFLGTLVMVAAYARERARPVLYLGLGLGVVGVAFALYDLVAQPAWSLPLGTLSIVVHAVVALANVSLAIYAAHGFAQSPGLTRALVPSAFLVWGLSNYTWLLIDLGAPASFGLAVHLWRLLAVLLMLAALVVPRRQEVARGAA